jgi:CO/xanthine dehydrogenase Mo-binding subunit
LDADGRFLALRVEDTADLGAYLSQYGPYTAAGCGAPVQEGAYRISALDLRVRGCFTKTTPIDSCRGTGRLEATYVLERLIDQAAFELGIDRAALRERNMRAASDTPVVLSTGQAVDGGRFLDNVAAVGKTIKQIQAQAIALMAERHGVPLDAVKFDSGLFHVQNTNLAASLSELAACTPARLDVEVTTDIASGSYSNGCHACGQC